MKKNNVFFLPKNIQAGQVHRNDGGDVFLYRAVSEPSDSARYLERWKDVFLAYKVTSFRGDGHPPLQICLVRKMYRKGMVSTFGSQGGDEWSEIQQFGVWVALEPVGGHQLYWSFSEKSREACKTTQR